MTHRKWVVWIQGNDAEIASAYQWCLESFGGKGWSQPHRIDDGGTIPAFASFVFTRKKDATLFRLFQQNVVNDPTKPS